MKQLFKNLATPNSAKATKVLLSIKVTCAGLAVSTFAAARPEVSFVLLIVAGAADIIVSAVDRGDANKTTNDGNS